MSVEMGLSIPTSANNIPTDNSILYNTFLFKHNSHAFSVDDICGALRCKYQRYETWISPPLCSYCLYWSFLLFDTAITAIQTLITEHNKWCRYQHVALWSSMIMLPVQNSLLIITGLFSRLQIEAADIWGMHDPLCCICLEWSMKCFVLSYLLDDAMNASHSWIYRESKVRKETHKTSFLSPHSL